MLELIIKHLAAGSQKVAKIFSSKFLPGSDACQGQ
jgi:hypothetical protein